MKSYHFQLIRRGKVLDETAIDDNDKEFAKELFYGEFGHIRKRGDEIKFHGWNYG
ncbi:hypothetical protein LCGC14_0622790 [marine sediment metagenome]|uniref:Uncharacterized protein n=1 Tax=marine sediment metagenome TaxID=412755 RepID=A0A0F9UCX8_9ZZZZ